MIKPPLRQVARQASAPRVASPVPPKSCWERLREWCGLCTRKVQFDDYAHRGRLADDDTSLV